MSNKDFAKYEQSRLAYFESKAVLETAHLEGKIEGKIETTIDVIAACILEGLSIERTAKIAKVSIEYVHEIMQKLGLSNNKN